MFIRKLYYLKSTGDVLVSYMMSGSFVMPTRDWDYEYEQALRPYADQRNHVGAFVWEQPDPEVEREFNTAYGVSVDVTAEPHQLVFDYNPPPPRPDPPNDVDLALDMLDGKVEIPYGVE